MERKRSALIKRNKKIAKKDKDLKRLVFRSKRTGEHFMLSNKKTEEKIDAVSSGVKGFLKNHFGGSNGRFSRKSFSSLMV